MSRKITKVELYTFLFILFFVGLCYVINIIGYIVPVVIIAVIFILIFVAKTKKKKDRLRYLRNKYKNEQIVQNIFGKCFWQGQTAEQLIDAIGRPEGIDQVFLKTKKKEIWKYQRKTKTRFGLRITLENDIVIGWDQK